MSSVKEVSGNTTLITGSFPDLRTNNKASAHGGSPFDDPDASPRDLDCTTTADVDFDFSKGILDALLDAAPAETGEESCFGDRVAIKTIRKDAVRHILQTVIY